MGNNLKTIRSNNSGKTQKQVAEELGISLSAYRTYEQGTRHLTDELLLQLSTYFSVSVDSILGSKFSASLSSPSFLEDSEIRSIVNAAVSEMNKEDRQQFRKLLESYMALSSTGRKQLAESADTMNRSGKYVNTRDLEILPKATPQLVLTVEPRPPKQSNGAFNTRVLCPDWKTIRGSHY